jgi:hypothetical protein
MRSIPRPKLSLVCVAEFLAIDAREIGEERLALFRLSNSATSRRSKPSWAILAKRPPFYRVTRSRWR